MCMDSALTNQLVQQFCHHLYEQLMGGFLPIFPECWGSVDVVNPLKASFSMVAIRVLPAMILGCVWCAEKSVSVCAVTVYVHNYNP